MIVAAISVDESPERLSTATTRPRATSVSPSKIVEAAPMSGLITERTEENTYTGKVVEPGTLTNWLTITLSRLNVNASKPAGEQGREHQRQRDLAEGSGRRGVEVGRRLLQRLVEARPCGPGR